MAAYQMFPRLLCVGIGTWGLSEEVLNASRNVLVWLEGLYSLGAVNLLHIEAILREAVNACSVG